MPKRSSHILVWRLVCAAMLCLGLLGWLGTAQAQAPIVDATAQPPAVQDLVRLLGDPAVRSWLDQQAAGAAAPKETEEEVVVEASDQLMSSRIAAVREHVHLLGKSLPQVGPALGDAWGRLQGELFEWGLWKVLLLIAAFVAFGFLLETLYWRLTAGYRQKVIGGADLSTPRGRLLGLARRLMVSIGWVASFALGSIGAFLAFDWPPLLREIILAFLQAFLLLRLTLVVGRVLIHPFVEKYRTIPLAPEVGRFWWIWSGVFVGCWALMAATRGVLETLGLPSGPLAVIMQAFVLVMTAVIVVGVWQRPLLPGVDGEPAPPRRGWLWTALFSILWIIGTAGGKGLIWLCLAALSLRVALPLTSRTIAYLTRTEADAPAETKFAPLTLLCIERGARIAWFLLAAYLVVDAYDIDFGAMATNDTVGTKLLRGAVNALVIALVAEFLWHAVRGWLDGQIEAAKQEGSGDDAQRRARLRTLLPIVRNIMLVVIVVMGVLMALSSLGLEVGPLIAGAGVVGVAIGFGAQTIVKDVISGMFYLLDDAFRVGEYIMSGSYKGTVESFSLRSIKLRHHRGPLFTVPFGELGAVQNMSRDWVIDKMSLGLEYGTDLDKVKRIVKQIGKELLENPEFQPNIIDTLKMQGVESFGDYAIQVRLKLSTKPGEQFVIRRRAYAMIQKAFAENGIKFARPTVNVGGAAAGDASAAVAQQALDLAKAKEAAAA